jgi:hypothetical protein
MIGYVRLHTFSLFELFSDNIYDICIFVKRGCMCHSYQTEMNKSTNGPPSIKQNGNLFGNGAVPYRHIYFFILGLHYSLRFKM